MKRSLAYTELSALAENQPPYVFERSPHKRSMVAISSLKMTITTAPSWCHDTILHDGDFGRLKCLGAQAAAAAPETQLSSLLTLLALGGTGQDDAPPERVESPRSVEELPSTPCVLPAAAAAAEERGPFSFERAPSPVVEPPDAFHQSCVQRRVLEESRRRDDYAGPELFILLVA